jgi:hypothetical protein
MSDEFWTMKEGGVAFGVTSHVIGKRLKEIGVRSADGKPSGAAFPGGYCARHWTSDGRNYCWAWEWTKTIESLERAGLTPADGNSGR